MHRRRRVSAAIVFVVGDDVADPGAKPDFAVTGAEQQLTVVGTDDSLLARLTRQIARASSLRQRPWGGRQGL